MMIDGKYGERESGGGGHVSNSTESRNSLMTSALRTFPPSGLAQFGSMRHAFVCFSREQKLERVSKKTSHFLASFCRGTNLT